MKKIFKVVISTLILIGLVCMLWLVVTYLLSWLSHLDKEVSAAVIASFMGLLGILYAQWHSKLKEIADSHRAAKIEVYETFFDIVERFMNAEKNNEVLDFENVEFPDDLKDQFTKLSRGMIVWSSPRVIKAWSKFRDRAGASNSPAETLLVVDDVLQAIRADLGNSNFGLTRGSVIKLYISNPGEIVGF